MTVWRCLAVTAILVASAAIAVADVSGLPIMAHDKWLHFSAFAVMTLLAANAFPDVRLSQMLVVLAILGGVIELLQFTSNRQRDWADFGANVLGIDVALIIVIFVRRLFQSEAATAAVTGAD
jgi:hypothetical protein